MPSTCSSSATSAAGSATCARRSTSSRTTLHPAGVAVWFADEEILAARERDWDQLVDEATDAERYCRRLSRRIREGYASKLAKQRDPGGRPPFGFRRDAGKLLEPIPSSRRTVLRAFELAAARLTDREVAAQTGLSLYTVRGMLNSPLYAGRLPDGAAAHWAPIVPPRLWDDVQAVRELRAGPATAGPPAPRSTPCRCSAARHCGRRLIGDTGRYRHTGPLRGLHGAHVDPPRGPGRRGPLEGRPSTRPAQSTRPTNTSTWSARSSARVALGADDIAEVIGHRAYPSPTASPSLGSNANGMLRWHATVGTRDRGALEADDGRGWTRPSGRRPRRRRARAPRAAAEVARLPAQPAGACGTRRPTRGARLAESLFERIEVLGLQTMHVEPTAAAVRRGLARHFVRMRWLWSGREDLNLRPHRPERCALPSCATPRPNAR